MAKITRIKASDTPREKVADTPTTTRKKSVASKNKPTQAKSAKQKNDEKSVKKAEKADKKTFILFRPFVAIGRYFKNSWSEIRQVRWPNRKATWKMVFAVIIYSIIFLVLIALLDLFFSWLVGLIINK